MVTEAHSEIFTNKRVTFTIFLCVTQTVKQLRGSINHFSVFYFIVNQD